MLNLILLCVGYFYLGQWQKGLVGLTGGLFLTILSWGIAAPFIAIGAAIDGYYQALELEAGHPIGQWTFLHNHR